MLSLPEDEPLEDVGEQTLGESDLLKKKRSRLNGKSQPPSAKRLKLAGGAAEPPKKSEKQRTSVAKTRGSFNNPTKPMWSVVAGPGSSRKNPEQVQIDVRPRLWSSNREELGSTFTEISISKCANNVSWTLTGMPILILDNEFISLDNPEIGDMLCMDVTFIRQFVCAPSDACPQPPDIQPEVANIKQENTPRGTNSSCAQPATPAQRAGPTDSQECQEQIQATQVLSEKQPPPGPLATSVPLEGPSASEDSTLAVTKGPPPLPVIVEGSNPKSRKIQPKRKRTTQPLQKEPFQPPVPGPKLSQHLAQGKKTTGVLSSLRFKKNKPTPSDSPHDSGASQVSCQSPLPTLSPVSDSPQSANASGPQLSGTSALQPPKQAQTDNFCQLSAPYPPGPAVSRSPQPSETLPEYPASHSSQPSHPLPPWRAAPENPAAGQNAVVNGRTNFDPPSQYYPDNRFLPKLKYFPHTVFQNLDTPASTSFPHHPAKRFKVDLEQLGEIAQREGPDDRKVGVAIIEPSVATQCWCSRFRYDPRCPFYGDVGEARKYTPPPERSSVQRGTQVKSETGQREQFLSVPVGPRMMSNWPNNIRLNRRPWVALQAQSVDKTQDIPSRRLIGPCSPPHDWTELHTLPNIIDTLDVGARSPIYPPLPSPAPVAIGGTASQVIGGQSVATLPSRAPESSKRQFTKLHGPGLTGESHLPTEHVPLLGSCAPVQAPTTSITNDSGKGLTTNINSISLPLLDQVIPTTDNTISSSLKRKGKERCREAESSDDEPLSVRVGRQYTVKKAKLRHERTVNGYHMPLIQVCQLTMTIACSSKTRLEDLPILAPVEHVPTKNGVRVANSSGLRIERPSQAPVPLVSTKPVRRRGRPAKNAKPAPSTAPQLPIDDISRPIDPDVPQQTPRVQPEPPLSLSISAAKSKSRATNPKPFKSQRSPLAPISSIHRKDNGVPVSIPDEIQALIDAYITGMPIGIFAAKQQMKSFWGLKLSHGEEIGYAFMGFYRVSRVWECLIEGEVDANGGDGVDKARGRRPVEGIVKLRVRWRFRMRWEPGGEDWQVRERDKLSSPWWNPALKPRGLSMLPQPNLEDSDDESTIVYRTGRRKNPNFARRHCFFNQAFFSVLPLHLLAPALTEIPDSAFPRGWHCEDCGKLNFRYYLRHRQCSSSSCKDKPEIEGYAVDIDRLRDPQDALPLSLPLNELPGNVPCETKVQVWKDRMKTLVYRLGVAGGENAGSTVMRHIFTCNLKDLQMEASELLNAVQKDVPLRRVLTETNPYFMYHAGESDGGSGKFAPWGSVPKCLHRAQELMNDRGRKYGRRSAAELDIRQLVIRAWVTAGNKRDSDLLCAKQRCIAIMCLGCEVIMSIGPKSVMASNGDQARIPDLDKLTPMEGFDPQDVKLETAPLVESGVGVKAETGTAPMDTDDQIRSALAISTKVGAEAKRVEKTVLSVSLVHGDMLLLEGDDFEYAIKRTGTSILLFGS